MTEGAGKRLAIRAITLVVLAGLIGFAIKGIWGLGGAILGVATSLLYALNFLSSHLNRAQTQKIADPKVVMTMLARLLAIVAIGGAVWFFGKALLVEFLLTFSGGFAFFVFTELREALRKPRAARSDLFLGP